MSAPAPARLITIAIRHYVPLFREER